MADNQKIKFTSFGDFKEKFLGLRKGPSFIKTFIKLDKRLREKIIIAVSMANECAD